MHLTGLEAMGAALSFQCPLTSLISPSLLRYLRRRPAGSMGDHEEPATSFPSARRAKGADVRRAREGRRSLCVSYRFLSTALDDVVRPTSQGSRQVPTQGCGSPVSVCSAHRDLAHFNQLSPAHVPPFCGKSEEKRMGPLGGHTAHSSANTHSEDTEPGPFICSSPNSRCFLGLYSSWGCKIRSCRQGSALGRLPF